ncbi:MAG: AMP-binding protein [Spirochaetales bacterium]|nr:AMP-binding protein [Spirochaetales bacterium]
MAFKNINPDAYKFLDEFRGKDFTGEWPTIVEMFTISVKRFADRECFKAFSPELVVFTYKEAYEKIKAVSRYLLSTGVKAGDKIAVSGKNSPEWAIAYLGILFAGCVVVPLDIAHNDHDMETLMAFGDVKRLFIDKDRTENIDKDKKVGLEAIYSLEKGANVPYVLDLDADCDIEPYKAKEDDVAAILFTSGTTGTPKGVMLTNKNLVSDTYTAQLYMKLYPTDVFYAILPIHHAYTMLAVLFETIGSGASCVFGKRLVVSQMLRELREGKITMLLAVPMLFNKLISALMDGVKKKSKLLYVVVRIMMSISGFLKKYLHINVGKHWFGFLLKKISLENCRICICGGGPLPASTFRMFNQLGINFVQGYGLTETSPITHLNPVEAYKEESVGRFIPSVQTKIVDPDSDGNGILYVKGPMVMKGYYKNEEDTKAVLSDDGWLNTGDVGHEDSDGYLILTGRAKSIIVTEGGKNVFPEEIENHFQLYYDIEDLCVIGYVMDAKTKSEGIGIVIKPTDECKSNHPNDIQQYMELIVQEVNKQLHSYNKISKVLVVDEPLEKTSTKKVKRFAVQAKYASLLQEQK